MKTILFVCEANTCRSPMAAALINRFRHPSIQAISAGSTAFWNDGILPVACDVLTFAATTPNANNDYRNHLSHPLQPKDFENADLIVCLSDTVWNEISQTFGTKENIVLLDIPGPSGQEMSQLLSYLSHLRPKTDQLFRTYCNEEDGIFPMIQEDLRDVLAIENSSFSIPWSQASFESALRNPTTHPIVYRQNGQIVGYAVSSLIYETAELYNIAVSPLHRKIGIGAKLLEFVIQNCSENGAETLFLEVRRSNSSARKLYESFGFVYDSVRKNYYKEPVEDALLMHLPLITRNNYDNPSI